MDVLVLIDKLDDLIHNARAVPLTDQVRVDREEIYDLLDQMRATIPEEIKQARWIVKERQEMLAEAKREAERIVTEARDKAAQEASEQEVIKQAEREAADILEDARSREREIRLGAEDYADEILGTLEVNLGKFLAAVQRGRERLQGRSDEHDRRGAALPRARRCRRDGEEVATVDLRALDLAPGAADPRCGLAVPPVELRLGGQDYRTDPAAPEVELEVSRSLSGLHLRLRTTVDLVGPCVRCMEPARVAVAVDTSEFVADDRPPTTPRSTRTSTRSTSRATGSTWPSGRATRSPRSSRSPSSAARTAPACARPAARTATSARCDCVVEVADSRWDALRELAERLAEEPGTG